MLNDSAILSLPQTLKMEIEVLRDQRDMYRSLLLADPQELNAFLSRAMNSIDRLHSLVHTPTRDTTSFRGKISRLVSELDGLSEARGRVELPTVMTRLVRTRDMLAEILRRPQPSGNDLLPAQAALEGFCSHLLIAADLAAKANERDQGASLLEDLDPTQEHHRFELAAALRHLVGKVAEEHAKVVALNAQGLERLPEAWSLTLFDLLSALLRNAIEFGIELPAERVKRSKPAIGALQIDVTGDDFLGFKIAIRDDGAGIDTDSIANSAMTLGLLQPDMLATMKQSHVAGLIFKPGVTTAMASGHRGLGMQTVRDLVQQLGGRVKVASHRGRYTRCLIELPGPSQRTQPAPVAQSA